MEYYENEQVLIDAGYVEVFEGSFKEDDFVYVRDSNKINKRGFFEGLTIPVWKDQYRCFRKKEVEKREFQVGDRVKVVGRNRNNDHEFKIGTSGVIEEIGKTRESWYYVDSGFDSWWVGGEMLDLFTKEQPKQTHQGECVIHKSTMKKELVKKKTEHPIYNNESYYGIKPTGNDEIVEGDYEYYKSMVANLKKGFYL